MTTDAIIFKKVSGLYGYGYFLKDKSPVPPYIRVPGGNWSRVVYLKRDFAVASLIEGLNNDSGVEFEEKDVSVRLGVDCHLVE